LTWSKPRSTILLSHVFGRKTGYTFAGHA